LGKKNFPTGLVVTIQMWEIDNLKEDAANLFLRIDDMDAARNAGDAMKSLAVQYPDLRGVDAKFIVAAVNGIIYHLRELNDRQKDKDKRAKIHKRKLRGFYLADKNYRIFICWLNHWNSLKDEQTGKPRKAINRWLLTKPALVAEAMSNYFSASEAAAKFWDYLVDDAGPKGHPTKELVGTLNEWRSRSKGKAPKPKSWRELVAQAWKEFRAEFDAQKGKIKKAS
jgi:hypothetical protein